MADSAGMVLNNSVTYPANKTFSQGNEFSLGDTVWLPDGQKGILHYIGPIDGKKGEFAGVELIEEWASNGRHNGEFNGQVYIYICFFW